MRSFLFAIAPGGYGPLSSNTLPRGWAQRLRLTSETSCFPAGVHIQVKPTGVIGNNKLSQAIRRANQYMV
jgi:hypothetical protein